ncbi:MAG TPA: hypothetical protein PLL10_06720, partial [Elusimicrobiales bacterium]|nr:hypothetical protein [Elusimicrobiales bacterium]
MARAIAFIFSVFLVFPCVSHAGWRDRASDRYFSGRTSDALEIYLDHAHSSSEAALEAAFILMESGDSAKAELLLSS